MDYLGNHRATRNMRPALLAVSALVAALAVGGTAETAAAHGPAHENTASYADAGAGHKAAAQPAGCDAYASHLRSPGR